MSCCYLAFRTNVLLNLYCPGHLSYFSPNESEPMISGLTVCMKNPVFRENLHSESGKSLLRKKRKEE